MTSLLIQENDNSKSSPANPDDEMEIDAVPPSNVDISKVIPSMIRILLSLGEMSKQKTLRRFFSSVRNNGRYLIVSSSFYIC